MPQNYSVEISADNVTYTALTNVQDIALSIGRQRQLDAYNASTATITMRYPTGYASPLTGLTSGNFVRIKNLTSAYTLFRGVINNVDVSYGIPYGGGVGQADYLTFSVEGSFARLGRAQGLNYSMAAGTLTAQVANCTTQSGVTTSYTGTYNNAMGATTVTGTWGDWVNKVLVTMNGRMHDCFEVGRVYLYSPFDTPATNAIGFSDTANNATNQVYDQINFGSYADNYYTQVTVDPENFAESTVQTGSSPYRTLFTNTFNASTSQATDYANYLLQNYNTKGQALLSISCLAEAQNVMKLDQFTGSGSLAIYPGTQVTVTFRGTVFTCIIEGVSMSATPESSRYTFYLSSADLNAYLKLDNTIFGRLDYNKLGY